jgi:hypothetical protein
MGWYISSAEVCVFSFSFDTVLPRSVIAVHVVIVRTNTGWIVLLDPFLSLFRSPLHALFYPLLLFMSIYQKTMGITKHKELTTQNLKSKAQPIGSFTIVSLASSFSLNFFFSVILRQIKPFSVLFPLYLANKHVGTW